MLPRMFECHLKNGGDIVTGRDLIVYILENGLEDEPVFKDGKFIGFITDTEAAVRLKTGVATVQAMCNLEILPGVKIGEKLYIPANTKLESKDFYLINTRRE